MFVWLKRILNQGLVRSGSRLKESQDRHAELLAQCSTLKEESSQMHVLLEKTIAMYEVAKIISKSLEEEKVFVDFRAQLDKYLTLKQAKFLGPAVDLKEYAQWDIMPLLIDHQLIGYLAAEGIRQEQKDIFFILGHQFTLGIKRAVLYKKVQELAIVDTPTGAFTRRYFLERLKDELARSNNFQYNFSLLMVDIDHFKECNDHFGHLVGDAILKEVSGVIKENIRQVDSLGRYGGEEFLITLIETDKNGARFAAERIRQAMETWPIRAYDEDLKVTLSIGVATYPEDSREIGSLIDKADRAMYRAKHAGRNRVCIHGVNK